MERKEQAFRGLEFSILSGAFVFGIVMSALGSILPALSASIGFEKVDAGRLFLSMNFAMLVGSLVFGPICDRFGFRTLLQISVVLVGGAFGFLAVAASYGQVLMSLAMLGFGGGALNGGTNALLNDISPGRRQGALNLLGIYFGCGALFTPFLIGSLVGGLGFRSLLAGLAGLTLAPLILFMMARFPAAKHAGGFSIIELRSVLRSPLLFLFGFLLFFQSGNEFTVGGWVSTYLGDRFHFGTGVASYVLAGYWFAIMIGRLAVARLGGAIASNKLVLAGALVALAGCAGLILTGNASVACAMIGLIGLGFASIFPTTLAQAGAAFPEYSGTAFSVIFVMALSGGMTAPYLVGQIAQGHGVGAGFWLTASSCGAIAVIQLIIGARPGGPHGKDGALAKVA